MKVEAKKTMGDGLWSKEMMYGDCGSYGKQENQKIEDGEEED